MLRYEFLFNKPCQKLDNLLEDSFERVKEQNLLSTPSVIFFFNCLFFLFKELNVMFIELCYFVDYE